MRLFVLIVLLACLSTPAFAMYKCEIDGRTVYRNQPCSGGKALESSSSSYRADLSLEQRLAQDKAKANRLERERHKREIREAREQRQAASSKKKCDNLVLRKKWAGEDATRASNQDSARIKARRVAELEAQGCDPI